MSPNTSTGGHISTGWVPLDIRHAVVVLRVHKHNIGGEVGLAFRLVTFVVEVVEVNVRVLLDTNRGNDDETAFRRPVDTVAVLLVVGADVLERTSACTLDFLGRKELHGGLGECLCSSDGLASSDQNEPIALGLPGEIYDSVLETVDDFDRYAFLLDAEDFEVRGQGFLGLGVSVNLDTDKFAFGLPMQFRIRDIEQVSSSDNLFAWNRH